MEIKDVVIMIPTYNPDDKFIMFLRSLREAQYRHIVVIDDGSSADRQHFFNEAEENFNCHIVRHSVNLGQGRAYKTGFNYYLSEVRPGGLFDGTTGIIQCDCDGQHTVEDVTKCAELLRDNPEQFILGVRNFKDKNIPFRSRFGNNCTTLVFKLFCGLDINDTQTGLKGIPASLIPTLMETPGERFEYASSVLLEVKKQGVKIKQFPIQTIYINGNETSKFNPLVDSIRIYSLILKYLLSSLSAFVVDIIIFTIAIHLSKHVIPLYYIITSTYVAKIFSCLYTYLVNRKIVFESKEGVGRTAVKFVMLCLIQSTLSAFLTHGLVGWLHWNEVISKILIDTLLFFMSFQIQSRVVFRNGK